MEFHIQIVFIILVFMTCCYSIAQILKDNSIIDIFWGIGFILIAAFSYWIHPSNAQFLNLICVTIWGLRLAIYLFVRNKGKGEDWRYQQMSMGWGKSAWLHAFFKIFMFQGICMFIVSLPIQQRDLNFSKLSALHFIGSIVFLIGFLWESIADAQLMKFKSNAANKGKLLTTGLWAYSRHPNYFGEAVVWWGIFLISIPQGNWWISIIGAIFITFLLMKVSGVPFLESRFKSHPDYQEYINSTNTFFPSFKKGISPK